jgi:ABC-2 type transport system permease protein
VKTFRDTALIYRRALGQTLRNPVWVVVGLMQPLYFLVLFGPLLTSVADHTPGFPQGGALNVFVPGLLIQMGLFGTLFVGFGLIAEIRYGVIERMRVTPVSRLALLLGRSLRDITILAVQGLLLVVMAWPFGLHVDAGALVVMLALLVLLGLAMVCISYALAMALRSEDALAPLLNAVSLPVMLLSGILLPLTLAPGWLRAVADVNPLTYAVNAARAVFNSHFADADVLKGVVVMAALAAVALAIAARSFNRSVA